MKKMNRGELPNTGDGQGKAEGVGEDTKAIDYEWLSWLSDMIAEPCFSPSLLCYLIFRMYCRSFQLIYKYFDTVVGLT